MKYPKIMTLYERHGKTFKVVPGYVTMPEFQMVTIWMITEKVDGKNARVILNPDGSVEIRGRYDKTTFNPVVLEMLRIKFLPELVRGAFETDEEGLYPLVVLYGEAYGELINKGGKYRPGHSFRLFDVRVGDWWLNWKDVVDVARKLALPTVPVLGYMPGNRFPRSRSEVLSWFIPEIDSLPGSRVAVVEKGALADPEGIVARTDPILCDRAGNRLMWKLKLRDFAE